MAYERRRLDTLLDQRLDVQDRAMREMDEKLDKLEGRINRLFGGLAVLSVIVNILAPLLAAPILRLIGTH